MISRGRASGMRWLLLWMLWGGGLSQVPAQTLSDSADSTRYSYQLMGEGNHYLLQHNREVALVCYQEALRFSSDTVTQAMIHQNIGCHYFLAGNYDLAAFHFLTSWQFLERPGNMGRNSIRDICLNLSACYLEMQKPAEAMHWVQEAWHLNDGTICPFTLRLYLYEGNILLRTGAYRKALQAYRTALSLPSACRNGLTEEIWLKKNMAFCLQGTGEADSALRLLEELALEVGHHYPQHPLLPELYYFSGHIALDAGRYPLANDLFESGLRQFDMQSESMNRNPCMKVVDRYRLQASRLIARYHLSTMIPDYPDTASEWLVEAQWILDAGEQFSDYEAQDKRLWVNRALQQLLYRMTLDRMVEMQSAGGDLTQDLIRMAERGKQFRRTISRDLNMDLFRIHKWLITSCQVSGLFHDTTETQRRIEVPVSSTRDQDNGAISLTGIRDLLDEDEAILFFSAGFRSLYGFLITADETRSLSVPLDDRLTTELNRFHETLKKGDYPGFVPFSSRLYRMLFHPFFPTLASKYRIMVFPDDLLMQLPVDALMDEQQAYPFLSREITYHSLLSRWYQRRISKRNLASTTDSLESIPGYPCDFFGFSPAGRGWPVHPPIPEATGEVSDLLQLFASGGKNVCYSSLETPDEWTLLQEMQQARIIHLALHGERDMEFPECSGWVLSDVPQPSPFHGLPDGKLELGELRPSSLSTELLTLSSCGIGTGYSTSWYRFPGFPDSFFDAGVQHLMFALWDVSDKHTRILMTRFYQAHLRGETFPASLQQAKQAMAMIPGTANPCLWAPWMLWEE